jgi:hypothetical protein
VRPVLVSHDGGDRHLAGHQRAPGVVGFRQLAVEALQHPLGDAAHVAHPGGRGDDQDVGGHHLLPDGRPGVAGAHVDLDAGLHVVVDDPDDVAGDPVLPELLEHLTGHEITAGRRWGGLEAAHEGEGAE